MRKGYLMRKLKILDVIVVGMFLFGLALVLLNRNTPQEAPITNTIIESPSQPDHLPSSNDETEAYYTKVSK